MLWVNLEKCASHQGQEAFFQKSGQKLKKKVLRACGADEKERVARAIHKLKAVVHAVVPPVVLEGAKNAPGTGQREFFHGHMEGKRAEPDGQRSNRSQQSEVNGSFPLRLGVQRVLASMENVVG